MTARVELLIYQRVDWNEMKLWEVPPYFYRKPPSSGISDFHRRKTIKTIGSPMNDCLFWRCWGHKFENISRSWAWIFWTIGCSCSLWSVAHNSDDYSLKKNSRSRFLRFRRSSRFQRFVQQLLLVALGTHGKTQKRQESVPPDCWISTFQLSSSGKTILSTPWGPDRTGQYRPMGWRNSSPMIVPVHRRWNSILGFNGKLLNSHGLQPVGTLVKTMAK